MEGLFRAMGKGGQELCEGKEVQCRRTGSMVYAYERCRTLLGSGAFECGHGCASGKDATRELRTHGHAHTRLCGHGCASGKDATREPGTHGHAHTRLSGHGCACGKDARREPRTHGHSKTCRNGIRGGAQLAGATHQPKQGTAAARATTGGGFSRLNARCVQWEPI